MSYTTDYPAAAGRHLAAADALADGPCRRVAGYLYGIAAECAIKALMKQAGLDPPIAHFPDLRKFARDRLEGNRSRLILRFIEDQRFMDQWHTDMRYCKGSEIKDSWIGDWQKQARNVVAMIGT